MRILIRAITPKRQVRLDPQVVERELRSVLNDDVKSDLLSDFRKTVNGWKTQVDFTARTFIAFDSIKMTVSPTGDGTKIWGYVNSGTRPHIIRPKRRGGVLAFRGGVRAKTKPGRISSGAGGSSGATVFSREVRHPGTEPRNFDTLIADNNRPKFKRLCENGLRRALRKS